MELHSFILVSLIGLLLGSFANMCIYRIPRNMDIVLKRSHCTVCENSLKPRDLVPIFSFLKLRGKCRYCRTSIGTKYLTIEIIAVIISIMTFLKHGASIEYLFFIPVITILIVISFIDFDHMIVPDSLVIAIVMASIIKGMYKFNLVGFYYLTEILKSFAFIFTMFIIIYIASKGSIGHGDIKLFLALSLLLRLHDSINAFIVTYITAATVSIILVLLKKKRINSIIPFAPFISFSFFIVGILKIHFI